MSEQLTDQLREKVREARMYFRRGYSMIDAAGNAGLHVDVLDRHLTADDFKANEAVWNYGPGQGWTA